MSRDTELQVIRCKLDNIVPVDGRYSRDFLNAIHKEIVDQKVKVEVKRSGVEKFPLPVFVHMARGNDNLARTFIRRG